MRRRALLAVVAGGFTLAGCITSSDAPAGSTDASPDPTASDPTASVSPGKPNDTQTAARMTADGVEATFRVVGSGGTPIEEEVDATFDGDEVTVTGSIDPAGCNKPTLDAVSYDSAAGRVELVVGETNPYGETATVECGNARYDFRSVVTVEEGTPNAVAVTYDRPGRDDQTFTFERERATSDGQ
jgi:hypothetical protein